MSAAICTAPTLRNGVRSMADTNTKPVNLAEIARKIRALRTLSQMTNYSLNRTIGQLLDRLNEDQLVQVGELLTTTSNAKQEDSK